MTIVLAVIAGGALGFVLERGDMCFHSTWRGLLLLPRRTDLFGAYILLLLISIPAVQALRQFGWIDPVIPSFAWKANIVGGAIFGVGMVVAASCITGLFYKLGHGMLGTAVGVAAWAAGDVVVWRGPLSGLQESLRSSVVTVDGGPATVQAQFGSIGVVALVTLGVGAAIYVRRTPCGSRGGLWNWLRLGTLAAAVLTAAWLLADLHGANYTYGTSGVPTFFWDHLRGNGSGSWWIPVALISIVPGAFAAAHLGRTMWVRGENAKRYVQLGVGGAIMGVGAAIAGGCNLGHSMVGVPLLSLGSIVTTLALIAGIGLGHYLLPLTRISLFSTAEVTDRR